MAGDGSLVLHYTFDRDEGEVVTDRSPCGNDGRVVNARYLPEVEGRKGVLRFDGESAYVDCGNSPSLDLSGDATLEMWVRLNGPVRSNWAFIFGEDQILDPRNSFSFLIAFQHSPVLFYSDGSGSMLVPVDNRVLSGAWGHLAIVVEYPRCRFYHNGVLVRDAYMPTMGLVSCENRPKRIGGAPMGHAPIDLAEFRVYRRALSEAEVRTHAAEQELSPPPATAELAVEPNWYKGTLALRLTCKGADYSGCSADMALLAGDRSQVVSRQAVPLGEVFPGCGRYSAAAAFSLSGLEGRGYDAVARLRDAQGNVVRTVCRHVFLAKPDWIHTPEGRCDDVLPPWTPVEAAEKPDGTLEIGVWGRRYVFGDAPFLRQIHTRDADILAGPMRLSARIDGKEMAWTPASRKLVEHSRTGAVVEQAAESEAAALRVTTRIEYDGYVIFDCALQARRDLSVDGLTLEIPLLTRHATLCFADFAYPEVPGFPLKRYHIGAVRGDLSFRFSPNVWLGDEERGLCWQAESDQDWHYADEQRAIQVLPRDETTVFRANLADVQVRLRQGRELRYRFALMATPMRPFGRDCWDLRICVNAWEEGWPSAPVEIVSEPFLRRLAEGGSRDLLLSALDMWPYPMPVTERLRHALHRVIDTAHACGLRIHPYLIHERFPTHAPEFDIYGSDIIVRPVQLYPPTGVYGQTAQGTVMACVKSKALQDACLHSLARRLDEFGDDGVYLDGTAVHIVPCRNMEHGCGYRAPDGSIRPTYPVFAGREFMRRIYALVKRRRPDGLMDVHSWCFNAAGLAYADCLWTAEQWSHLRNKGAEYVSEELPLDMFRTMFMGCQIGVPTEIIHYRLTGDRKRTPHKLWATTLLHDVPIRAMDDVPGLLEMTQSLWRLRDRFGASEAEKLFYWNNQDYVSVSPEKCYATLLRHPRNGVLALVSNLRRDAQTVAVRFNLEKLGLAGRALDVFHALTGEPLNMTSGGEVSLPLGSEEWAYLWLRPKGTGQP